MNLNRDDVWSNDWWIECLEKLGSEIELNDAIKKERKKERKKDRKEKKKGNRLETTA